MSSMYQPSRVVAPSEPKRQRSTTEPTMPPRSKVTKCQPWVPENTGVCSGKGPGVPPGRIVCV